MSLALRNLSGDPSVAGLPWSLLSGVLWTTREDLSGGGVFVEPRNETVTPGSNGPVMVNDARPWQVTVGTWGMSVQGGGTIAFNDPSTGVRTVETRGIAGCDFSTREYLNPGPNGGTLTREIPTFATCGPRGLPGSVTFGAFAVDRVISPNYYNHLNISGLAYVDGVPRFHGCFNYDVRTVDPIMRCMTISDRFVGDTFGFPLVTPEPGTWALLGSGLVGLGAVARRRRAA